MQTSENLPGSATLLRSLLGHSYLDSFNGVNARFGFDSNKRDWTQILLRHLAKKWQEMTSTPQSKILFCFASTGMAEVPSLKSRENAAVLGIRRSSSHKKEIAGSCSRKAVEKEGAGHVLATKNRLASTAERDGERLNPVAKHLIIYSGSAARCILSKC